MTEEALVYYSTDPAISAITNALKGPTSSASKIRDLIARAKRVSFIYRLGSGDKEGQVIAYDRLYVAPYINMGGPKGKIGLRESEIINLGAHSTSISPHYTLETLRQQLGEKKVSFDVAQKIAAAFVKIHNISSGIPDRIDEYEDYIASPSDNLEHGIEGLTSGSAPKRASGGAPVGVPHVTYALML